MFYPLLVLRFVSISIHMAKFNEKHQILSWQSCIYYAAAAKCRLRGSFACELAPLMSGFAILLLVTTELFDF
ncbi:conserved hypothetical protein [Vibrio jasicida]|uniref:Uncharacterized protein n=1 Tax=Vibrio jasicida TaxID=766224 RepID=A0AAU9QS67_9VIBR|nr:hypothetical protein SN11_11070 [Vibrio harveyi]CAH1597156.1 conserved hypothetical protein [Vibrio jasicida]CAH1600630.1 conserved hypothetical protein [Vibrio jasicida]